MRYYLRLLKYLKPLMGRFFVGLVFTGLFAIFGGFSLGMVYPVVERILVEREHPAVDQPEGYDLSIYHQVSQLTRESWSHFREKGWSKELRESTKTNVIRIMEATSRKEVLEFLCLVAILLIFLKLTFGYLQNFIFIGLEHKVVMRLRNDLYRKLHTLPLSFFHRHQTGQLISRVINDVQAINAFSISTMANLFRDLFQSTVFLYVAIRISPRLSLITFLILPPILIIVAKIAGKLKKYSGRVQKRIADMSSIIHEAVTGVRVVKAFAMEEYEINRFKRETHRYYKTCVKLLRVNSLASPFSELCGTLMGVTIFWYGWRQVLNGTLSPGLFLVFLAFVLSMMHPLKNISQAYSSIQRGVAPAQRVFSIIDMKADIEEMPGAIEIDSLREGIFFRNVNFRYDEGREVLKGIQLAIRRGEVVAFVGPSGGGKTTLVDLVPRFYDPTSGVVEIDCIDIRKYKIMDLRNLMGIVTQETILFNDTVFNNIAYGLEEIDDESVCRAARAANAYEFIQEMPNGFQTVIGEKGVKLSGGQRQRLAIARAILKNPPILILDEATSALDTESERLVQDAIEHLMENRTTLVIAHRLSTIQHADKIVVLKGGRIVESGSHQELIAANKLYKKLSEMQFK